MNEDTARSLARRLKMTPDGTATRAGIEAALVAGGYDPDKVEPDSPQGYIEMALSDGRAWNPAYLTPREIVAFQKAVEEALNGDPF
jgi:hypothetical protein